MFRFEEESIDAAAAERPGLGRVPGASYIGTETVVVGNLKRIRSVAYTTTNTVTEFHKPLE